MRAIGVIGSPHRNGNSFLLLLSVMEKIREKFDTEIIFLKDYNIRPCDGCQYCEVPNHCIINDDMQRIYPKLISANVIILSSPTYMGGVTSRLRAFMERT